MLVSTATVKNPVVLFMGNYHARRIKNIALSNGVSTG